MPRHVVRSGDTLKAIVKKYNAKAHNVILANNHLDNLERLNPGDVLYIPDPGDGALSPLEARTLKQQLLSMMGFSARQIQEHHKIYLESTKKLNDIRIKLRAAIPQDTNLVVNGFHSLKILESHLAASCKLHELYFESLGGQGGSATGPILEVIVREFGSYDYWEKDFKATGLAGNGWVLLVYDLDEGHLHNYVQDTLNAAPLLRLEPLLVMDMHEHAYFLDYGTNAKSYIDAFFRNIDWLTVNTRFANCAGHNK